MPDYLPFPYDLPAGSSLPEGTKTEYRVPIPGAEAAEKLRNRKAVPSNQMFEYTVRAAKH